MERQKNPQESSSLKDPMLNGLKNLRRACLYQVFSSIFMSITLTLFFSLSFSQQITGAYVIYFFAGISILSFSLLLFFISYRAFLTSLEHFNREKPGVFYVPLMLLKIIDSKARNLILVALVTEVISGIMFHVMGNKPAEILSFALSVFMIDFLLLLFYVGVILFFFKLKDEFNATLFQTTATLLIVPLSTNLVPGLFGLILLLLSLPISQYTVFTSLISFFFINLIIFILAGLETFSLVGRAETERSLNIVNTEGS